MSLSALVNGADCGPVNPLQGLTKRLDGHPNAQQDLLRRGVAGPSRPTFREPSQPTSSAASREATEFFRGQNQPGASSSQLIATSPFDLNPLQHALPGPSQPMLQGWAADFNTTQKPQQSIQPASAASYHSSAWAADFVQSNSRPAQIASPVPVLHPTNLAMGLSPAPYQPIHTPMVGFNPMVSHLQHSIQNVHTSQAPATPSQDAASWAAHFNEVERQTNQGPETVQQSEKPAEILVDDLAATAGLLLDSMKNETRTKFQQSQFMQLMQKLRDREVVVQGNDMVEVSSLPTVTSETDVKGKGKATDTPIELQRPGGLRRKSVHFEESSSTSAQLLREDPQSSSSTKQASEPNYFAQQNAEWGALQDSWDQLDTVLQGNSVDAELLTESGYTFQQNNPYLRRGQEGTTNHHAYHSAGWMAAHQSILEKEAEVQRNPRSARAWYELGVKQQENERETKAIDALRQAVELDPTLLEAWLALAISYTNESRKNESLTSILRWIDQNEQYKIASAKYMLLDEDFTTPSQKRDAAMQCLLDMARLNHEVEVDADIQIALAILLIGGDEYLKAQDCFKTALEVRPNDWLMYNRVGATLANNGKPEEALGYYYRALELHPTYIRARFNLGISCINLQRYEEAASHILDALVLQETEATYQKDPQSSPSSRGVENSALWDCLKSTCLYLQRHDLAVLCDKRDLARFREEFHT